MTTSSRTQSAIKKHVLSGAEGSKIENQHGGFSMIENTERCLSCERTSEQVPLLRLKYVEHEHWICPQCLPILIHKPERLPAVAGAWTQNKVEHHTPDE
jgi:hypothetical protein